MSVAKSDKDLQTFQESSTLSSTSTSTWTPTPQNSNENAAKMLLFILFFPISLLFVVNWEKFFELIAKVFFYFLAAFAFFVALAFAYSWMPLTVTTIVTGIVAFRVGTSLDDLKPKTCGSMNKKWLYPPKFIFWTFIIVALVILAFNVIQLILKLTIWFIGFLLSCLIWITQSLLPLMVAGFIISFATIAMNRCLPEGLLKNHFIQVLKGFELLLARIRRSLEKLNNSED